MPEEKEVVSSEEVEKVADVETQEEQKTEEEGFAKEGETVNTGKYNQALRKLREAELEKKELAEKLAEKETPVVEEKEEEDLFKEEEPKVDPAKLIDERLKPINDALAKREENDKKIQRTAFFEAHPEYLSNSEKWQGILDEVDNFNSDSGDYYTLLEKAHRIIAGDTDNAEIENKKKEIANDAASSGDGAEKISVKEEFTAEERKYQKEFNISDEGMRVYKKGISSGTIRTL